MEKDISTIIDAIENKKGTDITVIDLKGISGLTDYFVIATGSSEPNIKAIADEVDDKMEEAGRKRIGIEGYSEAKWILLDYGDIIIHVFHKDTRDFYSLDQMWNHAKTIVRN